MKDKILKITLILLIIFLIWLLTSCTTKTGIIFEKQKYYIDNKDTIYSYKVKETITLHQQ